MKHDPLAIAADVERLAQSEGFDALRDAAACIRDMHAQLHKPRKMPWAEDAETRRIRSMMEDEYRKAVERDGPWTMFNARTPEPTS